MHDVTGNATSQAGELKRAHAMLRGAVTRFTFCRPGGKFHFERPPAGEYVLLVGAEGHITRKLPVMVHADRELEPLTVELSPGKQMIFHVPASVSSPEFAITGSGGSMWEASYDANVDTWRSEVLPADTYTVELRAEGRESVTRRVRLGAQTDVIVELGQD